MIQLMGKIIQEVAVNENKEEVPPQTTKPRVEVEMAELYNCEKCKFETELASDLKKHMSGVHNVGIQNFKCDQCDFTTIHGTLLNSHIDTNHVIEDNTDPVICGQCGLTFPDEEQCSIHISLHMYRCYKYGFESEQKEEVLKHEKK